jgi:hypothetical protein
MHEQTERKKERWEGKVLFPILHKYHTPPKVSDDTRFFKAENSAGISPERILPCLIDRSEMRGIESVDQT